MRTCGGAGDDELKKTLIFVGIGVWLVAVLAAFGLVWRYKTTPGPEAQAPATWPRSSSVVPTTGKANLVMFVHPQCPCTKASMAELARLAVELGDQAQIHVVLVRPDGTEDGFEEGTIAERARAIAGTRIYLDRGGTESARFGAQTSGATVLYTDDGKLAFSGGLTTARGHEGRSPASERISNVVKRHARTHAATAPTFGCELDQHKPRAHHDQ
jgi:hypothetical protein